MEKTKVGVIVPRYKGMLLMAPYLQGHWKGKMACPGGKANEGETHLEAAIRETLEETGIVVPPNESVPLVGHQDKYDGFFFLWDLKEVPKVVQGLEPEKLGRWQFIPMVSISWNPDRFLQPHYNLVSKHIIRVDMERMGRRVSRP